MSHQFQPVNVSPAETVRVARAAFPKGTLIMRLRDELYSLYTDHDFADLFPVRGQPAACPWRLAMITIFQFLEGLTDRQAADAVRGRIDWKYGLGLELTDPGFDFSVLSGFRTRLVEGQAEQRLLNVMLARLQEEGLLKARGKQRTDATHVLAAIRTLNRLELVGETLRCALNRLAVVAPAWLRQQVTPAWFERYGVRIEAYRLPKTETERLALAATIGADGYHLLQAAWDEHAPPAVRTDAAVEVLRQVWVQQYYGPELPVRWRTADDWPPSERRIQSPYDVEARFGSKYGRGWVGYKVHLTETCEADQPEVITQVETTPATTPDEAATGTIHEDLAAKALLPAEHLVDAGYTSAAHLVTSRTDHGIDLVGPVAVDASWQARAGMGFDLSHFLIDWEAQTVTCPQGKVSRTWEPELDVAGKPQIHIRFSRRECQACPCRTDCTQAKTAPRELTIRPAAEYAALQVARQRQTTPEFKEQYALRAGVESTISQAVRVSDIRHSRYRGLARTHLQQIITAVALNVVRVTSWLSEIPRAPTRVSRFGALLAQT
jgi:transposase